MDVFNVNKGPGKVVAFPDGIKPCTFCGEARGSMYVLLLLASDVPK